MPYIVDVRERDCCLYLRTLFGYNGYPDRFAMLIWIIIQLSYYLFERRYVLDGMDSWNYNHAVNSKIEYHVVVNGILCKKNCRLLQK